MVFQKRTQIQMMSFYICAYDIYDIYVCTGIEMGRGRLTDSANPYLQNSKSC